MAAGVSIVYALRIKDEPGRHDVRVSRAHNWPRKAPPICRHHQRQRPHPVPLAEAVEHALAMVSSDYR
jgi:hypothetical protein